MFGLLAITYSEFDNHVGPQLLYQYPANVVSKDVFENISQYVIVGKHLCEKTIGVRTEQFQYVNYSVAIDSSKYDRNSLLFAVGVVLTLETDMDIYKPVLRRLANTLTALETEKEYLFQLSSKETLQVILQCAYEQLLHYRQAFLQFDEANLLIIKMFRAPLQPVVINDFDVPVLLMDKIGLIGLPWDITMQHLIHYINGEFHVKMLSAFAAMDIDCVKRSLQLLIYYQCCVITDVLYFTNIYAPTPVAFDILNVCNCILDGSSLSNSATVITADGHSVVVPIEMQDTLEIIEEIRIFSSHTLENLPSHTDICNILFRLQASVTLREVIVACVGIQSCCNFVTGDTKSNTSSDISSDNHSGRNTDLSTITESTRSQLTEESINSTGSYEESHRNDGNSETCLSRVNIRKLLTILIAKKAVRRVYDYPIYIGPNSIPVSEVSEEVKIRLSGKGWNADKERLLLNGNQTLESLCCMFRVHPAEIIANKENVRIIYK